jgi:4-aminobutyrate aminotransferase-like enzyme
VALMSEYFRLRLATMPFKREATVRTVGLAIAVDFGDERYCEKIGERCRRLGLLVSPEGESVLLIPALNIDRAAAKRGLDIFQEVVSGTA